MEPQRNFEDAENYSQNFGNESLSFREIILQHLKKISQFASVEFRGGYWEIKPDTSPSSNSEFKVYVPDTREVYSNSVECLADMLFPYFDETMIADEKRCKEEDKKAYTDNTIIKQLDKEEDSEEEIKTQRRKFKDMKGRVSYRSLRVRIVRELFRDLCSFLHRKKYLEVGNMED